MEYTHVFKAKHLVKGVAVVGREGAIAFRILIQFQECVLESLIGLCKKVACSRSGATLEKDKLRLRSRATCLVYSPL